MPPKVRITREELIAGTIAFWREKSPDEWNARSLARYLDISTQPIFSQFSGMEELKRASLGEALVFYQRFVESSMALGRWPAYKASGMAYVRFAREEPKLFRILFMRDRQEEKTVPDPVTDSVTEESLRIIAAQTGFDRAQAEMLHLEMWSCVHGIGVMFATGFLELSEEVVSRMLTDVYQGIVARMKKGESAT